MLYTIFLHHLNQLFLCVFFNLSKINTEAHQGAVFAKKVENDFLLRKFRLEDTCSITLKNPEQWGKFIFYLPSLLGSLDHLGDFPRVGLFLTHEKHVQMLIFAAKATCKWISTNLDENYSPTWIQSNFNSFTYYDGN